MCRYVDWNSNDDAVLRSLSKHVDASIETILDAFYAKVLDNPIARKVIEDAESSVDILRSTMGPWILDIFSGTPDEQSFSQQVRIGRRHVEVNLPQSYMLLGLNIVRDQLETLIWKIFKTDIKSARQALKSLNKSMDMRAAVMLRAYQNDRDKALRSRIMTENESMLALGRMSTTIAHEIKNPLASIGGAMQVLRGNRQDNSSDIPVMDAILEQVVRLSGTVKDLLDFARPVDVRREHVPLRNIVDSVVTLLTTDPKYDLRVEYANDRTRDLILAVDPMRIQSVFYNLFSNAIDANQKSPVIRIDSEIDDKKIQIRVTDDGPGIADDIVHRLFHPFATGKIHGTGLGLAICTKIIESHSGNIVYEPGSPGACFRITLPVTSS